MKHIVLKITNPSEIEFWKLSKIIRQIEERLVIM